MFQFHYGSIKSMTGAILQSNNIDVSIPLWFD